MRVGLLFVISGLLVGLSPKRLEAQRLVGRDTLYGNEWIAEGRAYLKMELTPGKLYRISYDSLRAKGWTDVNGSELELVAYGEEEALLVTNSGSWGPGDEALFFASNRGALAYNQSSYEVQSSREMLNPEAPTHGAKVVYFLSRAPGTRARYRDNGATQISPTLPRTSEAWTRAPVQQAATSFAKVLDSNNGSYSSFRAGEGYSYGAVQVTNLSALTPSALAGADGYGVIRAVASVVNRHRYFIALEGDTTLAQDVSPWSLQVDTVPLKSAAMMSANRLDLQIGGGAGATDRFAVGQVELYYRRTLDLAGVESLRFFTRSDAPQAVWSFGGIEPTGRLVVFNVDSRSARLGAAGEAEFATAAAANDRLVAARTDKIETASVTTVEFGAAIAAGTDYIVLTSRKLRDWETTPADWAAYRSTREGGGFRTQVIYIEDLYNRFGYGEAFQPLAVRGALSERMTRNTVAPAMLIIGKGREFRYTYADASRTPAATAQVYVPTFGVPGADNLLVYNPLTAKMTAAVGRIAVDEPKELSLALRKYRAAEQRETLPRTVEDRLWTKKLIHLVGGGNPNEQRSFQIQMDAAALTLEESSLGSFTSSFYKRSNQPVQQANSEELFDEINDGAFQITFLGHGSQSTLDFNIDNPARYDNGARLPIMFALGCYVGNMHTPGESIGERFLLGQENIVLGFGAGTGLGYPNVLTTFLTDYYRKIGGANYGGTIGESLLEVVEPLMRSNNRLFVHHGEQFNYQGDPGWRIYVGEAPDYVVVGDSTSLNGGAAGAFRAGRDSVRLNFEVANLGKRITDSISVAIERESAKLGRVVLDTVRLTSGAGNVRGRVTFEIGDDGGGLNRVYVRILDDGSQAPRPAALVNDAAPPFEFFVRDEALKIAYPSAGTRLTGDTVVMYAVMGSPWDSTRTYEWQLSTSPEFSGANPVTETVISKSLVRWDVTDRISPNTVYHVRIRDLAKDTLYAETYFTWDPSAGSTAYALTTQAELESSNRGTLKFDPIKGARFPRFELSKSIRNLEFDPLNIPSFVTNYDGPAGSIAPWYYMSKGLAIAYSDTLGVEVFNNSPGRYGSLALSGFNRVFAYPADTPENRDLIITLLDSIIPPTSYVYVFTVYHPGQELDAAQWGDASLGRTGKSVLGLLQAQGAKLTDEWAGRGTVPYTFIYQKDVKAMGESLGDDRGSTIFTEVFLDLPGREGFYASEDFAPVDSVKALRWSLSTPAATDTLAEVRTVLVGVLPKGDTVHLASSATWTGALDLTAIDVVPYAKLRFEQFQSNPGTRRAQNLDSLVLDITPLPDLVFDPQLAASRSSDTLSIGETFDYRLGVRNITPGKLRPGTTLKLDVKDLASGLTLGTDTLLMDGTDAVVASDRISLENVQGGRNLLLSIASSPEVRELSTENNTAGSALYVRPDNTAPILKVLVDGNPLRNGELLAPNPSFRFTLRDEGSRLLLSNQATLRVTLQGPDGAPARVIDPGLLSVEAAPRQNEAAWTFEPEGLVSGRYVLGVRAADGQGNFSGAAELRLEFEVETSFAVSALLPYPNPMVDRTRFQYELTGAVPADYRIQIFTVSGRLVHSLGPTELGALRIGRRITDGYWDGRTQYGDRLAAGTYLYRFDVGNANGDAEAEHRGTKADKYVKSGFGKLVILP